MKSKRVLRSRPSGMVVHDTKLELGSHSEWSTNNLPFHPLANRDLHYHYTIPLTLAGSVRSQISGAFHFVIGSTEISAATSFIWGRGTGFDPHYLLALTHSTWRPPTISDHRSSTESRFSLASRIRNSERGEKGMSCIGFSLNAEEEKKKKKKTLLRIAHG